MEMTLGKKMAELRRVKGMTQDEVAEELGVSAQAVSKWENDVSCPDIMLLPHISELFQVTIDELFSKESKALVTIVPEEERKDIDKMMLKVVVNSKKGDRVRVNLPIALVKIAYEIGMQLPEVSGNMALKDLDFEKIIALVDRGVIGKLVEVESADGDIVDVTVE
ncbi:MAG: helix-turn-helix transcriptional regulator [Lachnospiraceae bacterium]|nr:helix-turn-helix transcriptional regulator [Lachnospiraceae bacterium]